MDRAHPSVMAAPGAALLTDFYQLTMLQAYHAEGMNGPAVFELFVRALPESRNFLVAAGVGSLVDELQALRFEPSDLAWLRADGRFKPSFVESLASLRFTGDVDAMPEGTVFFPDEPIVRITAPVREAQLVESRLMNLVHFQTVVASKAARIVLAARAKPVVDFGLRRAHGAEAALLSARAAYLAGFEATATVEAARRFGVPAVGTMAHSYVQAHADESSAFEAFCRSQPAGASLLIDTYDTEAAAAKVVSLAASGARITGVRIDSGDLADHARRVRSILDAGGLHHVSILASGNLDEYRIAALEAQGAPIDRYGVGTRMNTSADAPFLDCAYKLEEYDGVPRRKRSEGKATWPGRKQVLRRRTADGHAEGDVVVVDGEPGEGEPLLVPCMRGGVPVLPRDSLIEARARVRRQLRRLPPRLRRLEAAEPYPVEISPGVRELAARFDARA